MARGLALFRSLGGSGAVALLLCSASDVRAQDAPVSTGTRVWVTTHDDHEQQGLLVSMSPSVVVLRVGTATQSILLADVQRIEGRDSLLNGVRNGGIIGAASLGTFGVYLSRAVCESSDGCFRQDLGPILALTGLGAGTGVAAGGAIDYLLKGRRLLYSSQGSTLLLRVMPMVRGRRGMGVRVSLTWPH